MPIDAIAPKHLGQYLQAPKPTLTRFRVIFSCNRTVLFMAMSFADVQLYLQNIQANAYFEGWIGPSENVTIEFTVPPGVPWAIIVVNRNEDHAAIHWQLFSYG